MLPVQRRERIIAELHKDRFLSVTELVRRLQSSLSTVRRDLVDLEREGAIVRTHGGAGLAGHGLPEEMTEAVRSQQHIEQKRAIGRAAARLIESAGSVAIDAGSTTLEVVRALNPAGPLRVVTDSLELAWELRDREHISVILTGGIMRQGAYNLYGPLAEQALLGLHTQVCVMGCTALSEEEGLTKHDIEALAVRRRMVEASRQLIVVADSTKLGKTGLVSVCELEQVDTVVTDSGISPTFRQMLEERGIHIVIADEQI